MGAIQNTALFISFLFFGASRWRRRVQATSAAGRPLDLSTSRAALLRRAQCGTRDALSVNGGEKVGH